MLKYIINKGVIIMTNKEIFFKYINGFRCTREEYLMAQEYLKTASDDIKDLYDSCMEYIVRSLINNKARSNNHFLAAANKHGLTEREALLLISEYTSKDLSSKNSKRK